jgi:ABC-type protease/lipase transport system fused ATPase/permease subunit
LPAGYDTPVGGPNDRLSAGARQRLGLARALFGDPRLLVLDEPYSNLDAAGAEALVTALRLAKEQGATIVIVAHRPSILAHADKILVLDAGGCRLIDRAAREREKARLQVVRPSSEDPAKPETSPVEVRPPAAAVPAPRTRRQPSKRVAKGK